MNNEDAKILFTSTKNQMDEKIHFFEKELSKIQTGGANPAILDNIKINYYETMTSINQITSISRPEARQLLIKPYDLSTIKQIVSAIHKSTINLTPIDEGDKIRINFPHLSNEKRQELVKDALLIAEKAKINIRQIRHHFNKIIKNNIQYNKDEIEYLLEEIQNITNQKIAKINDIINLKEKEILKV